MTVTLPARGKYWVLALVCLLSMITYLDRVCFGVAGPTLAGELGLSGVSDLYWPFTAFTIAYAIFEVPSGWLGDRLGPKKTLIRIVLWWSGFTALTGLAGLRLGPVVFGLGLLVAARFLFGAGEAGAYPNITRAIHNWFPANQWAMAQGCVWMSGRLMGGLTPLLWTVLVSGTAWTSPIVSWRTAFLLFGLIGVSWCMLFALTFRNGPAERNSVIQTETSHETPWRAMLQSGNLWTLCLMYFCVNYGWYFHITYLVGYMKDRYGLDDQSMLGAVYKGGPLWVGAAGCFLGGMVSVWLTNLLGDRGFARKALATVCLSVCALCWALAGRAPSPLGFFAATSAAAFFSDMTLGSAWATCQDIGRKSPAVVAACMNTIGAVGAAFASWLTGVIVAWAQGQRAVELGVALKQLAGSDLREATLAGYQDVFWSYAGAYVLAAACWVVIRPTQVIED